ncbi:hypothetical protein MFRU_020g00070 [Monilinia fructicola]|nr:hypothetical protein MFRU_020g00070 [Monilinia fructicola]
MPMSTLAFASKATCIVTRKQFHRPSKHSIRMTTPLAQRDHPISTNSSPETLTRKLLEAEYPADSLTAPRLHSHKLAPKIPIPHHPIPKTH